MPLEIESLVRERLIPAVTCADAARVFIQPFLFLEPREPSEFGMKRMIWSQE